MVEPADVLDRMPPSRTETTHTISTHTNHKTDTSDVLLSSLPSATASVSAQIRVKRLTSNDSITAKTDTANATTTGVSGVVRRASTYLLSASKGHKARGASLSGSRGVHPRDVRIRNEGDSDGRDGCDVFDRGLDRGQEVKSRRNRISLLALDRDDLMTTSSTALVEDCTEDTSTSSVVHADASCAADTMPLSVEEPTLVTSTHKSRQAKLTKSKIPHLNLKKSSLLRPLDRPTDSPALVDLQFAHAINQQDSNPTTESESTPPWAWKVAARRSLQTMSLPSDKNIK